MDWRLSETGPNLARSGRVQRAPEGRAASDKLTIAEALWVRRADRSRRPGAGPAAER